MQLIKRVIKNLLILSAGITTGVLVALVIMAIIFLLQGKLKLSSNFSGIRAYSVLSGSMEPYVKTGGMVVTVPQKTYDKGDVITFSVDSTESLVTHRIIDINENGEYLTKGDANEDLDSRPVTVDSVKGKVMLTVPYLGRAAMFTKQPQGFILLVIVPSTIIIYEELRSLFALISKKLKGNDSSNNEKRGINKALVIVPILGAFLVATAFANSYFSDMETSADNVLSAASDFGDPSPIGAPSPTDAPINPTILINEVYADGNNEWVELYNPNGFDVNIGKWNILDANGYPTSQNDELPEGSIIPAEGYVIIADNNADTSSASTGTLIIKLPNIGSGLNDAGDLVAIKNTSDVIIDEMSYGNETKIFTTPPPAPQEGESVSRIPNGTDTNTASDWQISTNPTMGQDNSI